MSLNLRTVGKTYHAYSLISIIIESVYSEVIALRDIFLVVFPLTFFRADRRTRSNNASARICEFCNRRHSDHRARRGRRSGRDDCKLVWLSVARSTACAMESTRQFGVAPRIHRRANVFGERTLICAG